MKRKEAKGRHDNSSVLQVVLLVLACLLLVNVAVQAVQIHNMADGGPAPRASASPTVASAPGVAAPPPSAPTMVGGC